MAARVAAQRVFVGNLPWTISKKELREYFSQFGHVAIASVVFNKDTGMSRGYGFVRFATRDGYIAATNKETHFIEGNSVVVQLAMGSDRNLPQ